MTEQNLRYILLEDHTIESQPATEAELENLREAWINTPSEEIGMRSCWLCNPAHFHFIRNGFMLRCFSCGTFYVNGVDITDYS